MPEYQKSKDVYPAIMSGILLKHLFHCLLMSTLLSSEAIEKIYEEKEIIYTLETIFSSIVLTFESPIHLDTLNH